jgi:hypothetical protein
VHARSLTTLGGAGDLVAPPAGHAGLVNRIPATVRTLVLPPSTWLKREV